MSKATKSSFCVMAVAVQAYRAWQFAAPGNDGDSSFWLLVAPWASFGLGYVYNEVRH